MKKIILSIDGMSCSACSSSLEKYLNKQKGIKSAYVNLVLATASIEYDDEIDIKDINKYIKDAGFKSLGIYDSKKVEKQNNNYLILFTILTIITLYISMAHMINLPSIPFLDIERHIDRYALTLLVITILYLIYGFDIIKSGIKNLIHKSSNMDTLVTIGVLSSFIYSLISTIIILIRNEHMPLYYESVCTIIYFIKLGRYIDKKSKDKTKEAIKELVTITPEYALLKNGKKITIDEIKKDDILICKPGMKIAVDGVITNGTTHVDESFITGESISSKKIKDMKVVAGSLNIDGSIEYRALKIGKDSTISEIVRLVVEATNTKAPISKIADKVSGIFVPTVIIISIITLIIYLILGYSISDSLIRFVTVLVVACPCALGLATPLATIVSEGVCAKNGILVKTSEVLELASKIDTVIFDKTGTLTFGKLKVSKINNYSTYTEKELLKIISSLESKSSHPIATAFKSDGLYKVTNFENIEGLGIKGTINNNNYYIGNNKIIDKLKINNLFIQDEKKLQEEGNSIVYVIENNQIISLIGVKDIVRNNAKKVIKELKKDKEIIMLTGDNELTASKVAKELGIDNVISNVLPKEKNEKIKELKQKHKVMMVGDGINDAPSISLADIGVSLSSGTDIASNSANVILMNDNLNSIINLIKISKNTIKNIKQNLFFAFFYNICMIPIAIGVFPSIKMNPMIGSIAMTLSSLTVVFNALRLRRVNQMFKSIETVINVEGMSCNHCANKVMDALKKIKIIKKVKVNLENKNVTILSKEELNLDEIAKIIEDLGYKYVKNVNKLK